jgi:hypothetical protein
VKPKPTKHKRTNTILNKALAGNTNLAGAIFYALIWGKYGMGYNGDMAKTHENAHTPILRSTDIQFIQSADKSQYRANVSESSPQYAREKSQYGSPRQYARESPYQYAREILQYGNPVQYASEKSQYRALVAFFGIFQYAE